MIYTRSGDHVMWLITWYSLLQEREVDEELWAVNHSFQVEVVLASEERELLLILEGDLVDLVAEWETLALF